MKRQGKDTEELRCQSRYVANWVWQPPFPLPSLASANPGCISWGNFSFYSQSQLLEKLKITPTHHLLPSLQGCLLSRPPPMRQHDDSPAFPGSPAHGPCTAALHSRARFFLGGHGLFFFHLFYFLYSSLNEQNLGPWPIFKRKKKKKRLFWFPFLRECWQ